MTLSALSMQMKGLEAQLGVALFDRASRPPRLTPLGRSVAEASAGFEATEARLATLCAPEAGLVGRFTIGFISSAAVRLMPGLLARMAHAAPHAALEVTSGLSEALSARVAAGAVDAALVTRTEGTRLATDVIVREPMCPIAVDGTLDGPFLHFRPDSGIGRLVVEILVRERLSPPRIVIDNVEAVVECVRQGLGWSILPRPDIERYGGGDMVIEDGPCGERDLVLVTRPDDELLRSALLEALDVS